MKKLIILTLVVAGFVMLMSFTPENDTTKGSVVSNSTSTITTDCCCAVTMNIKEKFKDDYGTMNTLTFYSNCNVKLKVTYFGMSTKNGAKVKDYVYIDANGKVERDCYCEVSDFTWTEY